jgi:signal transduction histidine kinase
LIAAGVVVFAGLTASVGATQGAPVRFLVLDTVFGLTFVVAGLLAWERRPDVRTGPLLLTAGALWWVGSYAPTGLMPYSLLGFTFERYYDIILALIALTFPAVALSRSGRLAITALVVGFVTRSLGRLFIGCECGPNPLMAVDDRALFDRVQIITSSIIVIAALTAAALALRRLRESTAPTTSILAPVAVAGTVATLVTAWDAADLIVFVLTGDGLVRIAEPGREVVSWTIIAAVSLVPLGYLMGVLRLRSRRSSLTSLAIELDRRPEPGDIQSAVRRALGDPSAVLCQKDIETGQWVALSGDTSETIEPAETQQVTAIDEEEPPVALVHDRSLLEDPGLLSAVVALVRLALENERLAEEVRAQLAEVRASRARLIEAAEAERRRVERDLHDGAQQRLIAIALALQEARDEARSLHPGAPFMRHLDETSEELLAAIEELRELARGIHPAVLTEDGLGVAVAGLARRALVPVTVHVELDQRLNPAVETAAYYVVAEALTNLTRHARATRASVRVVRSNGVLEVEVEDDGQGGADPAHGSGLRGLSDRLDAISGSLEVLSPPLGGTHLKASIPCG